MASFERSSARSAPSMMAGVAFRASGSRMMLAASLA